MGKLAAIARSLVASVLAVAITFGSAYGVVDAADPVRVRTGHTMLVVYLPPCEAWTGVIDPYRNRASPPYCDGQRHEPPGSGRRVCAIADGVLATGEDFGAVIHCDELPGNPQ